MINQSGPLSPIRYRFGCSFITFLFVVGKVACGILVSQPGIKPAVSTMEVQNLNHWTTREVPRILLNTVLLATANHHQLCERKIICQPFLCLFKIKCGFRSVCDKNFHFKIFLWHLLNDRVFTGTEFINSRGIIHPVLCNTQPTQAHTIHRFISFITFHYSEKKKKDTFFRIPFTPITLRTCL